MAEPMRIAVCDDARAVKMFLRHVLEEEGDMEVVSSTSTGRAALDEIGRHRPDALLLDLLLPDVPDPGALVRELRERSPQTAILLISNMPESRLKQEADRLAVDGWMLKAQRPEQMRDAVREALGGAAWALRSVVARRRAEDDPLGLGDRGAAQAQDGLEALGAELAGIERAAQLVQRGAVVFGDLVARDLEQDGLGRPPGARRHADVALAAPGVDALGGEHDGLAGLQALGDRRVEELRHALLDLLLRHAAGQERADLVAREDRALVLDHALEEAVALGGRGADHDDEAPGRVAHAVGGPQRARADRDVARPRGPVGARAIRRPRPALVVGDLHAAGAGRCFHAPIVPHGVDVLPPQALRRPRTRPSGTPCRPSRAAP